MIQQHETEGPVRATWAHASGPGAYAGTSDHDSAAEARKAAGYPYRLRSLEEIGGPLWRTPSRATVQVAQRAAHEAALVLAEQRMEYYYQQGASPSVGWAIYRLGRAVDGVKFDSSRFRRAVTRSCADCAR